MLIRPVRSEDFEAVAAVTNPYVLHTPIHFGTTPVTGADFRADWEAGRSRYAFLVAEEGGAIAGYAKTGAFRLRGAYQWTAETAVYLAAEHHRKGIASALYRRLIEVSRAQGFHVLIAGIALPNEASVRLHEKLGFVQGARLPELGYKLGRFHDVGFWWLRLSPADAPPAPLRPFSEVW